MSRIKRGGRAAPGRNTTKPAPSVQIDLKAAAAQASVTVPDGEYDVEIVDADFAVNERKNTVSLRLTPKIIDGDERIRLQPLCIHDGGAHNVPWYVQRNAKLVNDLLEAAGREVPDSLTDPSIFIGCRVLANVIEVQDGRGLPINELAEVFEADTVDNVEPLNSGDAA